MFRKLTVTLTNTTCGLSRGMSQEAKRAVGRPRLTGKVAVVTASTDGIGLSVARRLCDDGAQVVVSSRRMENVNRAVETLKSEGYTDLIGLQCDVAKPDHRARLFSETLAKFGGVDILVQNAAANPNMFGVMDTDEAEWDKIFNVNLKSTFMITKEVMPLMKKRGGGSIIYVSTAAAYYPFNLNRLPKGKMMGVYCVSKTALLGLTKAVAGQLAPFNIRCNCVAPGVIKTNFSGEIHDDPEVLDFILGIVPMNRMGVPEEISGVVSFLASQDSSYITGENIVVSGGTSSHL